MAIHIGDKIAQIAKEKRFSASELARQIQTSPQNMRMIFQRKSMDTALLLKISKAMNHNFFVYYVKEFGGNTYDSNPRPVSYTRVEERRETYNTKHSTRQQLEEKITQLERENELLREIHELHQIIKEKEQ